MKNLIKKKHRYIPIGFGNYLYYNNIIAFIKNNRISTSIYMVDGIINTQISVETLTKRVKGG